MKIISIHEAGDTKPHLILSGPTRVLLPPNDRLSWFAEPTVVANKQIHSHITDNAEYCICVSIGRIRDIVGDAA